VDLHGQTVNQSIEIVEDYVAMIEERLQSKDLDPNAKRFHILKVICGAGNHSVVKTKLKTAMNKYLGDYDYIFEADMNHGVFFLRID